VAFQLSKVPLIATDAFTLNFIELCACVIAKTGTSCARLNDGSKTDANRQRANNRMPANFSLSRFAVNYWFVRRVRSFGQIDSAESGRESESSNLTCPFSKPDLRERGREGKPVRLAGSLMSSRCQLYHWTGVVKSGASLN